MFSALFPMLVTPNLYHQHHKAGPVAVGNLVSAQVYVIM